MYLWLMGNPDLVQQLVDARSVRSEAVSRAGHLAITAVERAVVFGARTLAGGFRSLRRSAIRRRRRREAIDQLSSLDDRLLSDIGIARGEIVGLVDDALERGTVTLAELRGLTRPVPAAKRRDARDRDLPLAA